MLYIIFQVITNLECDVNTSGNLLGTENRDSTLLVLVGLLYIKQKVIKDSY